MTSRLFSPFTLGGLTLQNRVVVAPMCQYSVADGTPGDWHLMHLGSMAISGAALVVIEATAVEADGRITYGDTGLYSDANEEGFARVLAFCRSVGPARFGMQLSHAGRKGSTTAPWDGGGALSADEGAWITDAPSAIPYLDGWTPPRALDAAGLARIRDAFGAAAARAARLGLDYLEVHAAHGYLLHEFLSPLTNTRADAYGGSLDNRMRFPLECFAAVRAAFPEERPVTVRVSATDWIAGGFDLDQSIAFAEALRDAGCAAIHVTSGGLRQDQTLEPGPGYQIGFSAEIRRAARIPTIAVGQITDAVQAEQIVRTGQADLVALARAMLWDPRWVWKAALALGAEVALPAPYARAHPAMRARPFVKR
jgi:2,4-dienoyl-CoA reductase-like NADH-dependent reductase (Old Yellow Enzyme family)